ncbi:MAG TPA: DinB family protein [Puia sp.]|nr:DinB family protein [Puia sp.]
MTKFVHLEYWLRGPVAGIPPLLQPVAHAILQAREEVNVLMDGFPSEKLWERPGGVAAVGFHLRHLTGVLDRLLTYARGEALDRGQLEYLAREGVPGAGQGERAAAQTGELVERFNQQVDNALAQIAATPEESLTDVREVGRDKIPSTVGGLLFHAAEHTQRHLGQLLVTVRVIKSSGGETPGSRGAESEDGVDQIRQPL